jgi:peptidyl-prolyl cis-trans isomerase A (cyclophilin A)
MKVLIGSLVFGAVLLAQAPAPAPSKSTAAKSTAAKSAGSSAASSAKALNPAACVAKAPDLYRAKFSTTHGDFVIEVHRDWAPLGADRFYNLVKCGYFNAAAFYRYVPNFIVQWGAAANPAVEKAWLNKNIKDDPVKQHNTKGTVTFAMGGKDTRTTEIFVNLRDNTGSLDGQGFAPIGTVSEGMDIVEGLYSGYGDMAEMGGRGPSQGKLQTDGKAYIDKGFPKLDSINSTTIIFPEGTAAPAKKGTAPAAKSTAPSK